MLRSLINHIIRVRKKETTKNKGKGKNKPVFPASSSFSRWGYTSGAQGWVQGWSAKQTIEFHFLPTFRDGGRMSERYSDGECPGLESKQVTFGFPLIEQVH